MLTVNYHWRLHEHAGAQHKHDKTNISKNSKKTHLWWCCQNQQTKITNMENNRYTIPNKHLSDSAACLNIFEHKTQPSFQQRKHMSSFCLIKENSNVSPSSPSKNIKKETTYQTNPSKRILSNVEQNFVFRRKRKSSAKQQPKNIFVCFRKPRKNNPGENKFPNRTASLIVRGANGLWGDHLSCFRQSAIHVEERQDAFVLTS